MIGGIGCEKDTNTENFSYLKCAPVVIKGTKNDIIGKWKLVQKWSMVGTDGNAAVFDTIDVSCDNVYYEFKKDNLLTVSGNDNEIPIGTYLYSYQVINDCPACLPAPNLKIEGFDSIFCYVEEYKMIMTNKGKLFVRTK